MEAKSNFYFGLGLMCGSYTTLKAANKNQELLNQLPSDLRKFILGLADEIQKEQK